MGGAAATRPHLGRSVVRLLILQATVLLFIADWR